MVTGPDHRQHPCPRPCGSEGVPEGDGVLAAQTTQRVVGTPRDRTAHRHFQLGRHQPTDDEDPRGAIAGGERRKARSLLHGARPWSHRRA
jgi:hypothetical protein